MREDECRADEHADSAGAGGGVSQGLPAGGEEGEAAFAVAAQRSQEQVVGPVVDGEGFAVGGPLDGSLDAMTCAFVSGIASVGRSSCDAAQYRAPSTSWSWATLRSCRCPARATPARSRSA